MSGTDAYSHFCTTHLRASSPEGRAYKKWHGRQVVRPAARRGSSEKLLSRAPLQRPATLCFIQATPDAVCLSGGEREAQALLPHGADGAHGFGLILTRRSLILGLLIYGREEKVGIRSTA